jgi:hypothetical protein
VRSSARWTERVKSGDVGAQLLLGSPRANGEFSDAAGSPEFGGPVAHDGATSDDLAAPVLHDAQTMSEDRERRVRARHVGSAIGQVVAKLADDADHRVERIIDVVQEILDRDHGASLADRRPHRAAPPVVDHRDDPVVVLRPRHSQLHLIVDHVINRSTPGLLRPAP